MKNRINSKKGSLLIFVYAMAFFLLSISAAIVTHSNLERKAFEITQKKAQAFYACESGIDSALVALQSNQNYTGTSSPVSMYQGTTLMGQYETSVTSLGSVLKKVTATGYAPEKTATQGILQQINQSEGIARVASSPPPANFYNYAIYSSTDIGFTGNSYDVTGDIIYGHSGSNTGRVAGSVTHDATIDPLAHFDFLALRNKAITQGNLYTSTRLANGDAFPAAFYNASGEPNVVYVEGNLVLKGNTTAGGFFVVVGNILVDPTVTSDTTISGNVTVNGCIYSTGDCTINGGGNSMNINGGIWAGEQANLKGNAKVTYNSGYMNAVKTLVNNISSVTVQLISWRQLNLYS